MILVNRFGKAIQNLSMANWLVGLIVLKEGSQTQEKIRSIYFYGNGRARELGTEFGAQPQANTACSRVYGKVKDAVWIADKETGMRALSQLALGLQRKPSKQIYLVFNKGANHVGNVFREIVTKNTH